MIALIKQNLLHLVRSKFMVLFFVIPILIQYFVLKFADSATLYLNGRQASLGARELVTVLLVTQAIMGGYLTALYGIWMVPYLHQGDRSILLHVLPVPRFYFPVGYAITLGLMLLMEFIAMIAVCIFVFSWGGLIEMDFSWSRLGWGLLNEFFAFQVFMFLLAIFALSYGRLQTCFLAVFVLFVMNVLGLYYRVDFFSQSTDESWYVISKMLYGLLPPFGEFPWNPNLAKWGVWLGILMLLFNIRIWRPIFRVSAD